MLEERPDLCLIYGDTNSTLAAAIAAVKLHIPVGHVEAGIRRYDNTLPEEVNRRMADQICSLLFCSSEIYAENLRKENLSDGVFDVGDVTCDSYLHFAKHAYIPEAVKDAKDYVACTIHRPLNTDNSIRMGNVMCCLEAAGRNVILPLHPRSRKAAERYGLTWPKNVTLLEPVSYFEMIGLLEGADFVMTDSGGLQKDAAFAGKHCMTFAPDTPWRELKTLDVNRMVDDKPELVRANLEWAQAPLTDFKNPYGDGTASQKIVDRTLDFIDRM
jgi:UDP-N-acetylglucosamine 2-epimerase